MDQERNLRSLNSLERFVMYLFTLVAVALIVFGAIQNVPLLGLGFAGVLLFFAFLINQKLVRDRDWLLELPRIRAAERTRMAETLRVLAEEFDSTTVEDENGLISFSTVIGGQPVGFRALPRQLLISSPLPISEFRLFVYPKHQMVKSYFRYAIDLQVGNARFDEFFIIQSNDLERAKSLLHHRMQAGIMELEEMAEDEPMGIAFNGGSVSFSIPLPGSSKSLEVNKCIELLETLQRDLGVWSKEALVDILPSQMGVEIVTCLVCGDTIKETKVKCVLCNTLHHLDCWDYVGKCSVFGCGSTRHR